MVTTGAAGAPRVREVQDDMSSSFKCCLDSSGTQVIAQFLAKLNASASSPEALASRGAAAKVKFNPSVERHSLEVPAESAAKFNPSVDTLLARPAGMHSLEAPAAAELHSLEGPAESAAKFDPSEDTLLESTRTTKAIYDPKGVFPHGSDTDEVNAFDIGGWGPEDQPEADRWSWKLKPSTEPHVHTPVPKPAIPRSSSRTKSKKRGRRSSRESGERRDHSTSDERDCASTRRWYYVPGSEQRGRGNKDLFPICDTGTPKAMQPVARKESVATVGKGGGFDDLNLVNFHSGDDTDAADPLGDEATMSPIDYKPGLCVASSEQGVDHLQSGIKPMPASHPVLRASSPPPSERRVAFQSQPALVPDDMQLRKIVDQVLDGMGSGYKRGATSSASERESAASLYARPGTTFKSTPSSLSTIA